MNQKEIQELHSLHHEAVLISKNLIRDEFLLIEILQRIDHKKVYRCLGFKSLFKYATIALKLPECRAYTFILVARKAAGLSRMQEALKSKSLGLYQAKRITSVISKDNEDEWLNRAKILSQRSLERAVAKVNPRSAVEEGTRFISENTLEFKAAILQDTESALKRVQDLLSQSLGRAATYDEVLREMAKAYLDKKDPVIKAQRVLGKKIKAETLNASATQSGRPTTTRNITPQATLPQTIAAETTPAQELAPRLIASKNKTQDLSLRKPIPSELKHQVYLRDHGKCQDKHEGHICEDSRWIDIHHIKPVHQGGQNILENLITLCRGHHQIEHLDHVDVNFLR